MKKILLIAMAVMVTGMTSAQTFRSNKNAKVLPGKPMPTLVQAKTDGVIKAAPQLRSRIIKGNLELGEQLTLSQKALQSLKITSPAAVKAAPRKAASLKDSYTASGYNYSSKVTDVWTMTTGTIAESGEPCLTNVIPVPSVFSGQEAISVPYTMVNDTLIIKPTPVAEVDDEEDGKLYIMLFSAVDADGCIYMTVGEDGKITPTAGDHIAYGAWEQPEYKYEEDEDGNGELVGYLGYYNMYNNIKYLMEGEIVAPNALYEPAATYFHIGSSSSGYGYVVNYAVLPPYATIPFKNLTTDVADTWSWRMAQQSYNSEKGDYDDVEVFTADTRDFSINTLPETYSPAELTAALGDSVGETFMWGLPYEYQGEFNDAKIFCGELTSSLIFSDESEATLTRANTKDFGYYYSGSLSTAAKAPERGYTFSKLISYQGKPAAPLYITGVHFGVYQLEAKEDFNLKCKIQKMSFDARGRVVLGDVLAESEITYEDLGNISDGSFDWRNFYVEDEFGMTEEIDYVFVEDEFAVVIEGWDNGTFECYSLIDGCEFGDVSSTYFIQTGDENGTIYHYTSDYSHLDIGFYGGYGYLHTDDNTDLLFGKDGGTSTIHIVPMLYATDDETEEPTYSLSIESITTDEEEAEEIPEWINIEIANEDYSTDDEGNFVNGIDYDMVITTTALPEGVKSRAAQFVFMQPGAKLTVTVTQDADYDDAITTVVAEPVVKNSRAFNLAGQAIGKTFKGVVVKDGKKVLVK